MILAGAVVILFILAVAAGVLCYAGFLVGMGAVITMILFYGLSALFIVFFVMALTMSLYERRHNG